MADPICPGCGASNTWEKDRPPVNAWGCKSCGTHLCPKPSTLALLQNVNISPQIMGGLAREQSHPGKRVCPVCQQPMVTFSLKGAQVDACIGCGVTSFARGQLQTLLPRLPAMVLNEAAGLAQATDQPHPSLGRSADGSAQRATAFGEGAAASLPESQGRQSGGELSRCDRVMIRQSLKLGEQLGIEQKNDYVVDLGDSGAAHICEDGGGVSGVLVRQLMGARRPISMSFTNTQSQPAYRIQRKFYFWFPRVVVTAAENGRTVGAVQKRFGFFARKYDLLDGRGQAFAKIHAGFFRVWKFPIRDRQGQSEIGAISKKWSGFLKEAMTDADNFTIDMAPTFTEEQRAVTLAAAIGIDFEYFEKTSNAKTPVKMILSALGVLMFLFVSFCGDITGIGSRDDGASDLSNYDFTGTLLVAQGCYDNAENDEACQDCCQSDGAIFRDDDRACLCQGLVSRCEAADVREDSDAASNACASCCQTKMSASSWESSNWRDGAGHCLCVGGFNPSTMRSGKP